MSDDWYKRDVRKAISGMSTLTPEERGCYNTLIDHQYLMGGPLHDDDRYLAGLMNCDVRVWRRIRQQLVDKGRISLTSDGRIQDLRASYELATRQAQRSKRVASGQLGGIASGQSRKNKALAEAGASPPSNQIRREEKRENNKGAKAPSVGDELSKVLDAEHVAAVTEHRKKLRAPLSPHAAKLLAGKFAKCPDPNAAADEMIARGWRGFEPDWLQSKARDGPPSGVQRNGTGWHITHGTDEYTAWRRYAYAINNGDLIYGLPDKPGHVAHVPGRWPPRS